MSSEPNKEKNLVSEIIDKEKDQQQLGKEAKKNIRESYKLQEWRQSLREDNAKHETLPPDLDTSIKKITAFIRKIKNIGDQKWDSLHAEFNKYNLSRYTSEIVNAILEARLSSQSHISITVNLCSRLYQRYPDSVSTLTNSLLQVFKEGKYEEEKKEKDIGLKQRSTFRLLSELFFVQVIKDASFIYSALKTIMKNDKGNDPNHHHLSLITSFTRYAGEEFLGIISRKRISELNMLGQDPEKNPNSNVVSPDIQEKCLNLFLKYFGFITQKRYLKLHEKMVTIDIENHNLLMTKGQIPESLQNKCKDIHESFDKLQRNLSQLADSLDVDLPALPNLSIGTTKMEIAPELAIRNAAGQSPFEDESIRSFYEDLPDYKLTLPAVLLQGSNEREDKDEKKESIIETEKKSQDKQEEISPSSSKTSELTDNIETENIGYKRNQGLENLIQNIQKVRNRDSIDALSEEFFQYNSKNNRKWLARCAYNVHRSQLDLIPYYCRFVASIYQIYQDIGNELVMLLQNEFWRLFRKHDQIQKETRLRNVMFLGELTKFKICPPNLIFDILQACLNDFTHFNVDVTCFLLENCGRFLYLLPDTHIRCVMVLDRLWNFKNTKIDVSQETIIENAYYHCIPTQKVARKKKQKQPLYLYINKLLYKDLNHDTIEDVLIKLRKFSWDPPTAAYICHCLTKIHRYKFSNIGALASLVSGLNKFHPIIVPLVDHVVEIIRLGLERNDFTENQKRLATITFLGELYNFNVSNTQLIFDTLYLLITYGHYINKNGLLESIVDPRNDTFRISLVLTLLDTCGQYFNHGGTLIRLEYFLLHFQRYCLYKYFIPLDLEFQILDVFERVCPNMKIYNNLEEINQKINQFNNKTSCDNLIPLSIVSNNNISIPSLEYCSENTDLSASTLSTVSEIVDITLHSASSSSDDDELEEEFEEKEIYDDEELEDDEEEEEEDSEYNRGLTLEDIEFEKELSNIMQASIEERRYEPKLATIPESSSFVQTPQASTKTSNNYEALDLSVFKFATKFHNKPVFHNLLIPSDCDLVNNQLQEQQNQYEEQQERKRLLIQGLQNLGNTDSLPLTDEFKSKKNSTGAWTGGLSTVRLLDATDNLQPPPRIPRIFKKEKPSTTTKDISPEDAFNIDEQ